MPKKPTGRKSRHGKRRARTHRSPPPHTTVATDADHQRFVAELDEFVRALIERRDLEDGDFEDGDFDDGDFDDGDFDENEDELDEDEGLDGYAPASDFEPTARRLLFRTIEEIVATGNAQPAYDLPDQLSAREKQFNLFPGDGLRAGEMVAIELMLELRFRTRVDPVPIVDRVTEWLGPEHGHRALDVAGHLDHPGAPPGPTTHTTDDGAGAYLTAMVLLLAGAASIVGDHAP